MVVYSKIYLVVEDGKESFAAAVEEIKKMHRIKKSYGRNHYEVGISEMGYDLRLEQSKDYISSRHDYISLVSVGYLLPEHRPAFYEVFFQLCQRIDPLCGFAGSGFDLGPSFQNGEHYRNPYFFCIEPQTDKYEHSADISYPTDFVYDLNMQKKLDEIRNVLSLDELISLLRKYCKTVAVNPSGSVTVIKGDYGITEDIMLVRYHLAKEIRKRGVELPVGSAEAYAIELGVK